MDGLCTGFDVLSEPICAIDWSRSADWYDENAATFQSGAAMGRTEDLCRTFLDGLPAGARVLDAGCGTGRDAAFMQSLGYEVSAFDPSAAMIEMTRQAAPGAALRQIGFEEFHDPPGSWDAIWAMASLLHVPRDQFETCLTRLENSLTSAGCIFLCVKSGSGEGIDDRGRPMSYHTCAELSAMRPDAQVFEVTSTDSAGVETLWANMIIEAKNVHSDKNSDHGPIP